MKPPCKTNGIDCPNRAVGCHSKCEKYLAFRAEVDKINQARKKSCLSAAVAYQGMYANRRTLMKTQDGKRALAQR